MNLDMNNVSALYKIIVFFVILNIDAYFGVNTHLTMFMF